MNTASTARPPLMKPCHTCSFPTFPLAISCLAWTPLNPSVICVARFVKPSLREAISFPCSASLTFFESDSLGIVLLMSLMWSSLWREPFQVLSVITTAVIKMSSCQSRRDAEGYCCGRYGRNVSKSNERIVRYDADWGTPICL